MASAQVKSAILFAGLSAGEYYVAVSSRQNVPDPNHGVLPGSNGVFDPEEDGGASEHK